MEAGRWVVRVSKVGRATHFEAGSIKVGKEAGKQRNAHGEAREDEAGRQSEARQGRQVEAGRGRQPLGGRQEGGDRGRQGGSALQLHRYRLWKSEGRWQGEACRRLRGTEGRAGQGRARQAG